MLSELRSSVRRDGVAYISKEAWEEMSQRDRDRLGGLVPGGEHGWLPERDYYYLYSAGLLGGSR